MLAISCRKQKHKQKTPNRNSFNNKENQISSVSSVVTEIYWSDYGNQVKDEGLDSCVLKLADCRFYKYIQK